MKKLKDKKSKWKLLSSAWQQNPSVMSHAAQHYPSTLDSATINFGFGCLAGMNSNGPYWEQDQLVKNPPEHGTIC